MPLIFQSRVYRADLKANPGVLYVFGDNEGRVGRGGQAAEMRDEPNAVGVATLTYPGIYWTEANSEQQCAVVDADLVPVVDALKDGQTVVWPLDGIGTGLAQLEQHAPSTFKHIRVRLAALLEIMP